MLVIVERCLPAAILADLCGGPRVLLPLQSLDAPVSEGQVLRYENGFWHPDPRLNEERQQLARHLMEDVFET